MLYLHLLVWSFRMLLFSSLLDPRYHENCQSVCLCVCVVNTGVLSLDQELPSHWLFTLKPDTISYIYCCFLAPLELLINGHIQRSRSGGSQ